MGDRGLIALLKQAIPTTFLESKFWIFCIPQDVMENSYQKINLCAWRLVLSDFYTQQSLFR